MKIKFTECVEVVGSTCKRFEGSKKYISTGAIDEDHMNESDVETVTFVEKPSRANLVVSEGDIIFAKMQSTRKVMLIDSELAANIYSTGFFAVKAKQGIITNKCLLHLLSSDTFLSQKDKNCSGATQKSITNAGLEKIIVNIPEYVNQNQIAEKLDHIHRIIKLRREELYNLDQLIKARFVEMFGNVKANPYGFEKMTLKDTCTVITGNTPSRSVPEYYGDSIEWIKTDNIVSGRLSPSQALEYLSDEGLKVGRTVEKGAILMACIAGSVASIGRVCITDRKVAFNQQINAIVPEDYDSLFLHTMLQLSKEYLVEEINMALKGILSKSKLEGKEFIVPSIEQQKQFASFVAQVDKSKVAVQKALDEAQTLFDSLMQEYFG